MQYVRAMRAVIRDEAGVALGFVPVPVAGRGEVVIDVAFAGVCRSDLAVADGRIAVAPGRVLGHELAGRVHAIGEGVAGLATGDAVTAIPFGAGRCPLSRSPDPAGAEVEPGNPPALEPTPERSWWLGVDADGGFAEQVRVPATSVVRLPAALPLVLGAYVEPVAAALGALPSIAPGARVLVVGDGRIAELSARVIEAHGGVVSRSAAGRTFDVVVEHDGRAVAELLAAIRSGGTLVLKSRAPRSIMLDAGELVARDITVRGASHGSFDTAVDWLATRRIVVDDLIARPQPLAAFAEVFVAARASEAAKQMFAIAEPRGRT